METSVPTQMDAERLISSELIVPERILSIKRLDLEKILVRIRLHARPQQL